jgi:large subunit ribosomal protein L2
MWEQAFRFLNYGGPPIRGLKEETMALKKFNPEHPVTRTLIITDRKRLCIKARRKRTLTGRQEKNGRPQQPRPHHDAPYRRRSQAEIPHHRLEAPISSTWKATVLRLEYDPNRTSFIALIQYRMVRNHISSLRSV